MTSTELRTELIKEIERTFEKWVIDIHSGLNFLNLKSSIKSMFLTFLKDRNRKTLKISDLKISISKRGIPKSFPGDIYNVGFSSEKYGIKSHTIKVCL